ncbi:hypothetical protein [Microbacterium lacticum]|uniref:hypothetical protein n=1 Tax=Microbacterium lacticum TaxID=33885 RepID=UPI001F5A4EB9|nr:hypothetical protein [Microbacterium lacticum]
MADANKTLITRAEVTSIIDSATGRKALVIDGQTIELGDTGWRDLSGSLDALVTGRVLTRRKMDTIWWRFINIVLQPGASQAQNLLSGTDVLREPFLPDFIHAYAPVKVNATVEGRFSVLTAGSPRLDYATLGAAYSATFSFPVRGSGTWSSALPGVADGEPVGV